jgi:hypothetical protein
VGALGSAARGGCRVSADIRGIGLLTEGRELPARELSRRQLRVIAEWLAAGWERARQAVGPEDDEPKVSSLLVQRLKNLLSADDLRPDIAALIAGVSDDAKAVNVDGSNYNKRPDLHLILTDRSFDLRAECKLIDHDRGKDVGLYCNMGLLRFVVGDYAWERREAFMLAYVRDDSTIAARLLPKLQPFAHVGSDPYATLTPPSVVDGWPGDLAVSVHGRAFSYPNRPDAAPGPISVWHLWLSCQSAS